MVDPSKAALELALTVLKPIIGARQLRMPFHKAIALSRNPGAVALTDGFMLFFIKRLARGEEVGERARQLIECWAEQQIRRRDRKRGRRRDSAKELAVYFSYRQKLKANPKRKRDSILRELEQEFDLERRRPGHR